MTAARGHPARLGAAGYKTQLRNGGGPGQVRTQSLLALQIPLRFSPGEIVWWCARPRTLTMDGPGTRTISGSAGEKRVSVFLRRSQRNVV